MKESWVRESNRGRVSDQSDALGSLRFFREYDLEISHFVCAQVYHILMAFWPYGATAALFGPVVAQLPEDLLSLQNVVWPSISICVEGDVCFFSNMAFILVRESDVILLLDVFALNPCCIMLTPPICGRT